jgi:diguanylate cyclase (GGDEF)-like protein
LNRTETGLPITLLAGHTAVALLAALGLLTLVPPSLSDSLSWVAVPALTALVAGSLIFASRQVVLRARKAAVKEATTDPLTGLATPTAGERLLALEFAAAQRGRSLAIVLLRIEDFPRYASRHGDVVAGQLLRLAGRTMRRHQRRMHLTAHHGQQDGTFLSILSGMDLDGACVYGKRIRHALMTLPGLPTIPPISMGIVAFDMSMTSPGALVEQAERALERGAEAGGKVVVVGQVGAMADDD